MRPRAFSYNDPKTWPKNGKRVMVYGIWGSEIRNPDEHEDWHIATFTRDGEHWPDFELDDHSWILQKTVTHWMPLPKKPTD